MLSECEALQREVACHFRDGIGFQMPGKQKGMKLGLVERNLWVARPYRGGSHQNHALVVSHKVYRHSGAGTSGGDERLDTAIKVLA